LLGRSRRRQGPGRRADHTPLRPHQDEFYACQFAQPNIIARNLERGSPRLPGEMSEWACVDGSTPAERRRRRRSNQPEHGRQWLRAWGHAARSARRPAVAFRRGTGPASCGPAAFEVFRLGLL